MQLDFTKTLALVRGGLLDHEKTWTDYLEDCPGWQQTALVLTGPLFLFNALFTVRLSRLVGGYATYGYHSSWFLALISSLVLGAVGVVITVLVFNFMAGVFKGTPNFARAFAAVSLAVIPAWLAGVVAAVVPYLGFLIALAGGILTLVFLYRIMPLALNVTGEKRVIHFVVSLVVVIICNMIIAFVLGFGDVRNQARSSGYSAPGSAPARSASTGMMGEAVRQAELMDAASAASYDPPSDGKLDEDQVEDYVSVLRKTRAVQADYTEKMEKLAAEMKEKEKAGKSPSVADIGRMYSGAGGLLGANNAEMEVVISGGGNWAEHEWVKQQLRVARIQQGEGSAAVAHNYELYQEYEDELEDN
jgi:hypothetical protein